VLLGVGAVVAMVLVAGGVWSATMLLQPTRTTSADGTVHGAESATLGSVSGPEPGSIAGSVTSPRAGRDAEDLLAAEPLPLAAPELAQPGPLSTQDVGSLRLPPATAAGPADVPSGFPRTAEGALAQLISIDIAAIAPASVPSAQRVIQDWAAPGGPTPGDWSAVEAVAALLAAGGLPADGTASNAGAGGLGVSVTPAMGFIKGSIGTDFVVPCVDLVVAATLGGVTHRVAVADCQRMVWRGGRWLIGPGSEPAPPSSLWPGTQASFDAGYRWLETTP
jgi:hypothetical protein